MFGELSKGIVARLLGVVLVLGMLAPAVAPAQAQTPTIRAALSYNPCAGVTLNLDFTAKGGQGLYCLNGQRFGSFLAIPGASFTRASSGTAQDAAGNVIAFASGVPRVTDLGLLVEEARTNLVLQSQSLGTSPWGSTDTTITAGQFTAPDGSLTGALFTEGSAGTANTSIGATVVASSTDTASLFLKRAGGSPVTWMRLIYAVNGLANGVELWVNLQTGSLGTVQTRGTGTNVSATIAPAAQGYYRVSFTATGSAHTSAAVWFSSASGNGSAIPASGATYSPWGAQSEAAAAASSYIPTTSATVTRAADVPLITGLAINLKQGGMSAKWRQSAQKAQVSGLIAVDGGDGVNNRVQSFLDSSGKVGWRYSAGGADQIGADGSATVGAGVHKAGVAWSSAGFFGYVDGAQDITGALTPTATTLDTANVGVTISAHAALNDYLQSFSVYAAPPSIAQLQALTQ